MINHQIWYKNCKFNKYAFKTKKTTQHSKNILSKLLIFFSKCLKTNFKLIDQ